MKTALEERTKDTCLCEASAVCIRDLEEVVEMLENADANLVQVLQEAVEDGHQMQQRSADHPESEPAHGWRNASVRPRTFH